MFGFRLTQLNESSYHSHVSERTNCNRLPCRNADRTSHRRRPFLGDRLPHGWMRERDLHDQFEAWLNKQGIPYGHDRMDKATTTKTGEPDFRCYKNEQVAFVEFKVGHHTLSDVQVKRRDELARAGCRVRVCHDLETAIEWVTERLLGAQRPVAAQEPLSPPQSSKKLYLAQSRTLGPVVVMWDVGADDWVCVRIANEVDQRTLDPLPSFKMRGADKPR